MVLPSLKENAKFRSNPIIKKDPQGKESSLLTMNPRPFLNLAKFWKDESG